MAQDVAFLPSLKRHIAVLESPDNVFIIENGFLIVYARGWPASRSMIAF